MEKSQIFYSDKFGEVQEAIRGFLNSQEDYLSASTANSPRAVGDAIQDVLGSNLQQVLGEEIAKTIQQTLLEEQWLIWLSRMTTVSITSLM